MTELITGTNCIYAGIGLSALGFLCFIITSAVFSAKKKKIINSLVDEA